MAKSTRKKARSVARRAGLRRRLVRAEDYVRPKGSAVPEIPKVPGYGTLVVTVLPRGGLFIDHPAGPISVMFDPVAVGGRVRNRLLAHAPDTVRLRRFDPPPDVEHRAS